MNSAIRLQKKLVLLAVGLFLIKGFAWWRTGSVAIFTDALESIINIVAALFGWYSLWLSSKPRDRNHPYGHGKVQYISAAIEGTLIAIAGLAILFEAIRRFSNPTAVQELDLGLLLLALTGILNYAAGFIAQKKGTTDQSPALYAAGKHLKSDTYSTIGILLGLLLMKLSGWAWIDPVVALLMAGILFRMGYKVVRRSLGGIMDEADFDLLEELIHFLNANRRKEWIDLHNLRAIRYGNVLHLDGHLTLPWYFNVRQAHDELERLVSLIKSRFGESVELFVHTDPCEPPSCPHCQLHHCPVREAAFRKPIPWSLENVLKNQKHSVGIKKQILKN